MMLADDSARDDPSCCGEKYRPRISRTMWFQALELIEEVEGDIVEIERRVGGERWLKVLL
jgi:hypothetical protein